MATVTRPAHDTPRRAQQPPNLSFGPVAPAIQELRDALGADRVVSSMAVREHHGRDEGHHDGLPPEAVAFARSTDDVATIVTACARHRVPVIPFGAGTSLEGGIGALHGGICIDLSGLERIVEVNVEDLDCLVEAGVHRVALNDRLKRDGLFCPIDPGADATFGGMASTRASGTNTLSRIVP